MDEVPLGWLFALLFLLLALSAFFSSSETGLMSLNRYRLRHLAKSKQKGAVKASQLLDKPDRLIGLILLGNNFANILASSITALRLGGEGAIVISTGLLTLAVLIFSEVAPKTLAALYPEKIAFPAAIIYFPLLKLFYPIVWVINILANGVLKLAGINMSAKDHSSLSAEELRTVVNEAGKMISKRHQKMLLSILDLEKVTVEDIMIPRNDINGIDINADWHEIIETLNHSQHTRLPVYSDDINQVKGFIHMRNVLNISTHEDFNRDKLLTRMRDPYFIPEGTPLNTQLLNFQREERRIGLVVDEYGDIQGLVTLEDILEEIVGEFTSDPSTTTRDVHPQTDGTYLVDGSANIRELNRLLKWSLPVKGPKTLNGVILEHLESIPETGTSMLINNYPVEIVQISGTTVKTAKVSPRLHKNTKLTT